MKTKSARLHVGAALALALAACGGGSEGEEFAPGNSQLSPQQVDAALGPADQSSALDPSPSDSGENGAAAPGNQSNSAEEDEE